VRSICCNCPGRPTRCEPGCLCSCQTAKPDPIRFAGKVVSVTNHGTVVAVVVDPGGDADSRTVYFDRRMFTYFASSVDGRVVGLEVEVELGEFNFAERVTIAREAVEGAEVRL